MKVHSWLSLKMFSVRLKLLLYFDISVVFWTWSRTYLKNSYRFSRKLCIRTSNCFWILAAPQLGTFRQELFSTEKKWWKQITQLMQLNSLLQNGSMPERTHVPRCPYCPSHVMPYFCYSLADGMTRAIQN